VTVPAGAEPERPTVASVAALTLHAVCKPPNGVWRSPSLIQGNGAVVAEATTPPAPGPDVPQLDRAAGPAAKAGRDQLLDRREEDHAMRIRVLYFGVLRERVAHTNQEEVSLPPGATLRDLVDRLGQAHPKLDTVRRHVKFAVNEELASANQPLADGDVIALIPPVAGGAGSYCRLTDQPLSLDEVLSAVVGPGQGGVVAFIGLVRDHNDGRSVVRLEYEAYQPMALKSLAGIIDRCEAIAPGVRVGVAHRTGALAVGEVVVIIAASAPHRGEAFQAARECAELMKQETAIWKKEIGPDGVAWVGAPAQLSSVEPLGPRKEV
jgi:MoaE-MoaD fusion protein